jgi:hypothetical protein
MSQEESREIAMECQVISALGEARLTDEDAWERARDGVTAILRDNPPPEHVGLLKTLRALAETMRLQHQRARAEDAVRVHAANHRRIRARFGRLVALLRAGRAA